MSDIAAATIQQMFQTPFIKGLISQLTTPDMAFQRFYRVMENRQYTPVRNFGWDQFDKTRTIMSLSTPMTDAAVVRRQKIGTVNGTLARLAEKFMVYDEEIKHLRPPGAPIGTLNASGEEWVARQIKHHTQRHRNLMELLTVKTLKGGFGMKRVADRYIITDLNASGNEFDIDNHIPSSHKNQLALRDDGSNIIDSPWDNPTTNIVEQMFALRRAAVRINGYEPKHTWISSTMAGNLMNNISLQHVGGMVNRVFNTLTEQPAQVEPGNRNLGGMTIVFNAIPFMQFHVNDTVLSLPSTTDPQGTDSQEAADVTSLVANDEAIITPDFDAEWFTCWEGEEPIQEQGFSSPSIARGFHTFSRRLMNPLGPGREVYYLDNFLPVLPIPRAVFNPTISGFGG